MKINDLETFYEFLTPKFKKNSKIVIKFFVRSSENEYYLNLYIRKENLEFGKAPGKF